MVIEMPDKVKFIIETLLKNGFEAFAVGGCVRDSILMRIPEDWDITTSAKPYQVKKLFRRTIDTGIQHGTVTVMIEKEGFEVTTYRVDGNYEDCRHPKSVQFTTNLAEDLKRRDFTINAMAYNHKIGLVDEFGGIQDITKKCIACVGNPMERFSEDALRMLRAVRFSGQLGFVIDKNTKAAICLLADTIQHISKERIRAEIDKLIGSEHCERLEDAYKMGLTDYILPELNEMFQTTQNNPYHCYDVGTHCIKAVACFNNIIKRNERYQALSFSKKMNSILCWTLLFHDVGKIRTKTTDKKGMDHFYGHEEKGESIIKKIMKGLKFDNYSVAMVCKLVKWHDYQYGESLKEIRKALSQIGRDCIGPLFIVQYADAMAHNQNKSSEIIEKINRSEKLVRNILENNQCLSLKELNVNGKDLMEIGFEPGRELGRILDKLLDFVFEDPERNHREILLRKAKSYK